MAVQKTVMYKILAIALVFLVWWGSSERAAAAQLSYKMYELVITNKNSDGSLKHKQHNIYSYHTDETDKLHHFMYISGGTYNKFYVLYSFEPINVQTNIIQKNVYPDGSENVYTDTTSTKTPTTYNVGGKIVYVYELRAEQYTDNIELIERFDYTDVYIFSDLGNSRDLNKALERVILQQLPPDIPAEDPFVPNWAAIGDDPLLYIKNLQAEIVDGNIEVAWEPQPDVPYKYLEHVYINFSYNSKAPGTIQSVGSRRKYKLTGKYANMKDLSITIPLSDLDMPDGNIITSLHAQPFFYISDDTGNDTKRGQSTIIYFTEDGLSSSPIIVAPDIQDELPVENVEQNIFTSIQNFFSNFWRNITTTIKTAVVPESEDVLALLTEMNNWFSDRFGFIWYPFDLAIDIVAAFAIGEPNSKFTVPALTLNMLGGVKLWDSFEADLDPIGFLQYVRFFTSAIMCCGTVSLAIRKWDEWIGGEH